MSKEWNDHSEEEQLEILERISEIYKSHGNPAWLTNPNVTVQVVNNIGAKQQQTQSFITVEGKAPTNAKGLASTIAKEVSEALVSVQGAEINIGSSYGVGSQVGVIENANKVYINGVAESGSTSIEHKEG
jgi:hypothetical protein